MNRVLHRHVREGALSRDDARTLALRFSDHAASGLWNLVPVHEALLRRTASLIISAPRSLFIRTADALHRATAQEIGEPVVWTNDRHMLAAAAHLGLAGHSVAQA